METLAPLALFALGILMVFKGGDAFVDAAVWIAEVTGIPKLIIGATIVSFATALPELLVSLMATIEGSADMAAGNAVGSVMSNIGLIMGLSALLLPAGIGRRSLWDKGLLMIGATALLLAFALDGRLELLEGFALFGLCAVFLVISARGARDGDAAKRRAPRPKPKARAIAANTAKFCLGAAGIVAGAHLLAENGDKLAHIAGVPEHIIGLTMLAIGTSLPELVTTLTAITKRESALSVGNILGANIIDVTMILPSCALAAGGELPLRPQIAQLDLPALLALMCAAVFPALALRRFTRLQGFLLLTAYGAYIALLLGRI